MRALQQSFDDMVAHSYDEPLRPGSEQYEQLRNAFFAGALTVAVLGGELVDQELRDFTTEVRRRLHAAGGTI